MNCIHCCTHRCSCVLRLRLLLVVENRVWVISLPGYDEWHNQAFADIVTIVPADQLVAKALEASIPCCCVEILRGDFLQIIIPSKFIPMHALLDICAFIILSLFQYPLADRVNGEGCFRIGAGATVLVDGEEFERIQIYAK